jgi:hypothetical protein
MKRLLWLFVLALPLWTVPGRALAWGCCDWFPPTQIDAGINCHFNVHVYDWSVCGQLGPWYLYFPYEAHFMTPAPIHPYPNWPGPMMVESSPGVHAPAPAVSPSGPMLPPSPPAKSRPSSGGQPQTSFYRAPPRLPSPEPLALPTNYSQMPAYWYGW